MPEKEQSPKLGAGHAAAMWRQGLRELRAAVYPESNVAQPPEHGLYGTKTPGEVAQDRRIIDSDFDDEGRRDAIDQYRDMRRDERDEPEVDMDE